MRRDGLSWVALLATPVLIGCGGSRDQAVEVPADLVGVWVTESPVLADRVFEITHAELVFQTAPDAYTLHDIQGVESAERDGASEYDLAYRGLSGAMDVFRITRSGGELFIRSRPEVRWQRNADPKRDWPWRHPRGA